MTGDTVGRSLLRPVAPDAKPHIDLYRPYSNGHAADLSVTARAIHPSTDMRSVVKLHMSRGREAVYALPGHIQAGVEIRCQLLDSGTIGYQKLVAVHTEFVTRDSGYRTLVYADMTDRASDPFRDMLVVRESDRLDGRGPPPQEFLHRVGDRGVLGCEQAVAFRRPVIGRSRPPTRAQQESRKQCETPCRHSRSVVTHAPSALLRSSLDCVYLELILLDCSRDANQFPSKRFGLFLVIDLVNDILLTII